MQKVIKYSTDNITNAIQNTDEKGNVDYFYGRLSFLADGWNGQDLHINKDVLIKYAGSICGKFVVAKYNEWKQDVEAHESDLSIIGYIPPDAKVEFKQLEDGRTMAIVDCLLSKVYCQNIYDMFIADNFRSVSVEMSVDFADDEQEEISRFDIHGVTILGKDIAPAIKNANLQIVKFSKEQFIEAYENIKNSVIDTIVVTNTIPATEKFKATGKFRYVSLGPTLAEAIRRINNDESISVMFGDAI